jgi:hypothetical protein
MSGRPGSAGGPTGPLAFAWNPPPERIAIRCPDCGERATFEFGTFANVDDKATRNALYGNDACETFGVKQGGQKRVVVVHHALLDPENKADFHGISLSQGGWSEDGKRPPGREGTRLGSFTCDVCLLTKRHALTWPSDAYYVCTAQGHVIWAWTEEQWKLLRAYASASEEERPSYAENAYVHHVPPDLLSGKPLVDFIRRIDRLLEAGKA